MPCKTPSPSPKPNASSTPSSPDELDQLDEAINALSVEDLRNVVRRLIVDVGPVNRW